MSNEVKFFHPREGAWKQWIATATDDSTKVDQAKNAKDDLKAMLLSSLQMQHVVCLAGSGTSLGDVGGPGMWALWDNCVNTNPDTGRDARTQTASAKAVIELIGFDATKENNIEALLSRCEAYLQIHDADNVEKFVTSAKEIILNKCSAFLKADNNDQLEAHRTFVHRLSRRRARDSRMKLFTTNYDLCFELAASKLGLVVLDGFSFAQPRRFDPKNFLYDIVRRPTNGEDAGTPLEGVFFLYKLHGSVDWERTAGNTVINLKPKPELACLIYPAKGKYQQSYVQPHLELVSQYLSALREPNTCLIVMGFGFNDDHLAEPILAAFQSNPHLRLILVSPSAEQEATINGKGNKYWKEFLKLAERGEDVWLLNASFAQFVDVIPDLKSLSPAQSLERDIKRLVGNK